MSSFWVKFVTTLVQINLLLAKFKRLAIPESNGLHPEGLGVEIHSQSNIRNCQDKMINVVDGKRHNDQCSLPLGTGLDEGTVGDVLRESLHVFPNPIILPVKAAG